MVDLTRAPDPEANQGARRARAKQPRFGPAALITGASDGIGRACAEALAAKGYDLVLVARRAHLLDALAATLATKHGTQSHVIAADLGTPEGIAQVLAQTADLDIGLFVAAAGFGSIGAFLDRDVEDEANMIDVNCRAVVTLCHPIGQRMVDRRRGAIVLFGSLVGFQGVPGIATYAATKGFIQAFAEALGAELRPAGVHVLCVAPGPVATGFAARAGMQIGNADRPEAIARGTIAALGRVGTVRPGGLAKLLGWSLGMLPRGLRTQILAKVMNSMTAGK